jgi:hypothetical protein
MVVDAYVSIVPHASTSIADPVDTLCYSPYSLNDSAQCFMVKLGTTPPMIAARWSSHGQAYDHKQSTTGRYLGLS